MKHKSLPIFVSARQAALEDYRGAAMYWMKTPFGAPTMYAEFGKETLTCDFNVYLPDGCLLTSAKHEGLLTDIYDFLCVQTHPVTAGRKKRNHSGDRKKIILALTLIDYFLLNSESMLLHLYGFKAIVGWQLKKFYIDLASSNLITESVYKWKYLLKKYLEAGAASMPDDLYLKAIDSVPDIDYIHVASADRLLFPDDKTLKRVYAFLYNSNLCHRPSALPYRYTPNTVELSKLIYRNTIWGKNQHLLKPVYEELCFSPYERHQREYEGVLVRTGGDDPIRERANFRIYERTLLTFRHLADLDIGIPKRALEDLNDKDWFESLDLKEKGRFNTIPADLLMQALRQATHFFYSHAKHLLQSFSNVLEAAFAQKKSVKVFCSENDITQYLCNETKLLGVKYWSIKYNLTSLWKTVHSKEVEKESTSTFFFLLREKNEGLLELVQSMYGAIQIVVGFMMAARQGELTDLPIDCMDEANRWLYLLTRKSGYGDSRSLDARPIPAVAADMIQEIKEMHRRLQSAGLPKANGIFHTPNWDGGFSESAASYNAALDLFLDFINLPLCEDEKRFYFRQHQLRRGFAILFFSSASFAGMETLQWFMRQIDPKHLHNYLTNSIPGSIFRTLKAAAAAIMVRDGRQETVELAAHVEKMFNVSSHELMNERVFNKYVLHVDSLLANGEVEIEPVFFETADGTRYKIAVVIYGEDDEI